MHEKLFDLVASEQEESIQVNFEDGESCDRLRIKLINERRKYAKTAPVDASTIYIKRKKVSADKYILTIYKKVDKFQVFIGGKDVTAEYLLKGR